MSTSMDTIPKHGLNIAIVAGVVQHHSDVAPHIAKLHLMIPDGEAGTLVKVVLGERLRKTLGSLSALEGAFICVRGRLVQVNRKGGGISIEIVASKIQVLIESQSANGVNGSATGRPLRARRNGESTP